MGWILGGTFGTHAYGNRYTHGVRLHLHNRVVNLTPSNVEAFKAALAERGVDLP